MVSLSALPTVVESRIDWLTMSVSSPGACQSLLEWRDRRFAVLDQEGHREKLHAAYGYHFRTRAQASIGVGRRGCVATFSGGEAESGFRDCIDWASNVSRVDLAVTGRLNDPTSRLAEAQYRASGGAKRGRGRRSALTLILSEDRGDTLYVGSRKSDQLGRLYNKEKESGDAVYQGCWRWEVQFRRAAALSTARALRASMAPTQQIQATVASWFTRRGVGTAFDRLGDPLPNQVGAREPDDVRWLAWARKSVAPRAKEMALRYGWRYIAESLCGRIASYEGWETLLQGIEIEFSEVEE